MKECTIFFTFLISRAVIIFFFFKCFLFSYTAGFIVGYGRFCFICFFVVFFASGCC